MTQEQMKNKMNELQGWVDWLSNEYPNDAKFVIGMACDIYEHDFDDKVTEEMLNKLKINHK